MSKIGRYFGGDRTIWMVIVILTIFSLLAVYSSTGTLAYVQKRETSYFLFRHFFLLGVGFVAMYLMHKVPVASLKGISKYLLFFIIPILFYTLLRGSSLNQASRWLVVPGIGLSVQPSDMAKLALIMFIARYISNNQDNLKNLKTGYLPILAWILVVVILIFPANLSTAAMLFMITMIMLFVGRFNFLHLLGTVMLGIALLVMFYFLAPQLSAYGRVGTWANRIDRFVNEEEDSDGNFQAEQSQIAIVKGGFLGQGPGNSEQRNFLPHPYSDFIFAIIVEEYGLWGAVIVIIMYLVLFYRTGVIVARSTSIFASYLALGIGLTLTTQAFINMGVATGIFPVTGQTLPLVSMGGSSILFTGASLGILLSISRDAKKKVSAQVRR